MATKCRFKRQCEALEGQAEGLVEVLTGSAVEASPRSGEEKNTLQITIDDCSLPLKREACLRSELGLGLGDRIRAWASKTFSRAKRMKRKETIIW